MTPESQAPRAAADPAEGLRAPESFVSGRSRGHIAVVLIGAGQVVAFVLKAMVEDADKLVAFSFLVSIPGAWAFLAWLKRAYRNLPALRPTELKYTPGWAVGCWFIPFVNLVAPYRVMTELWRASDPDSKDPASRDNLIGWWWLSLVAAFFLDHFAKGDPLVVLSAGLLGVTSMALGIRIVLTVDRRQAEKNARLAIHGLDGGAEGDRAPVRSGKPEAPPVPSRSPVETREGGTEPDGTEDAITDVEISNDRRTDPTPVVTGISSAGGSITIEKGSVTAVSTAERQDGSSLQKERDSRGPARCLSWPRALILAACTFMLGGVAVGIVTFFREPADLRLARGLVLAVRAREACHREAERTFLAAHPPMQPPPTDATGRRRLTVEYLDSLSAESQKAQFLRERCHREDVEATALEITIRLRSEGSR